MVQIIPNTADNSSSQSVLSSPVATSPIELPQLPEVHDVPIFSATQIMDQQEKDFWYTLDMIKQESISGLDYNGNNEIDDFEINLINMADGDSENLTIADIFNFNLEEVKKTNAPEALYEIMNLEELGMDKDVFLLAMEAYGNLDTSYKTTEFYTIVDTTQGNDDKRCYVINMETHEVVLQTEMRLGENTGNTNIAGANREGSHETLSGVYTVGTRDDDLYYSEGMGKYAKRMDGIEDGINDQLRAKNCVIHDDNNPDYSYGCLAFADPVHEDGTLYSKDEMRDYIDTNFPDGMTIFVYPPEQYLEEYIDLSDLV